MAIENRLTYEYKASLHKRSFLWQVNTYITSIFFLKLLTLDTPPEILKKSSNEERTIFVFGILAMSVVSGLGKLNSMYENYKIEQYTKYWEEAYEYAKGELAVPIRNKKATEKFIFYCLQRYSLETEDDSDTDGVVEFKIGV